MKKVTLLLLLLSLFLSACAQGRPFIATENGGTGQTTEQAVNDANSAVKAFFDQAKPIVTTIVQSLTEMANTIFSAIPGIGVNTDEVEKLRQQIREGG